MTPDQIPPYAEGVCDDCGHPIECDDPHDCSEFACSTCTERTFPVEIPVDADLPPCQDCGSPTVPSGSCNTCPNCGSTTGCS